MTGLLRNLGAKALGVPSSMRPVARLRAAAATMPGDLAQEYLSFSTPEHLSAVEAFADRSADHAVPTSSLSVAPATMDLAMPGHEDGSAIRRADRPLAAFAAADDRDVREPPATASHDIESITLSPIPAISKPTSDAPAQRATANIAAHDIEAIIGAEIIARPAPDAAPRSVRPRNDAARFEVPVHARDASAREELTPDVHIHIGRVELTAVTAAPPARRTSAAQTRQPMALDEYLQQRKRKMP